MPQEKEDNQGPAGFGPVAPNILNAPDGPDGPDFGTATRAPHIPPSPVHSPAPADEEPKISLPNPAEIEKAYASDNKAIEQCEDEALEALFGRQITGRLEDPQNSATLAKLNNLIERFNATSARLEKIERACQLLSESIIK